MVLYESKILVKTSKYLLKNHLHIFIKLFYVVAETKGKVGGMAQCFALKCAIASRLKLQLKKKFG